MDDDQENSVPLTLQTKCDRAHAFDSLEAANAFVDDLPKYPINAITRRAVFLCERCGKYHLGKVRVQ